MTFQLRDHWVWDHWIIDDGERYHLFFLRASRALHDPFRRHAHASLGHAVSTDAEHWTLLPDAIVQAESPSFDDRAIWTGCTVRRPDGGLRIFYTGNSRSDAGFVQRIGWADSDDGITFTRTCARPLEADPRWYKKAGEDSPDEHWRDPFVFEHEGVWHMLITAQLKETDRLHAGVIGHAVSEDLDHWEVLPPLSGPCQFGQLEVSQSHVIDGQHVLVFSCNQDMQARTSEGGVWVAHGDSPLGPWDIEHARFIRPNRLYAGQAFRNRQGRWLYTGFDHGEERTDETFIGGVPRPIPWSQLSFECPRP